MNEVHCTPSIVEVTVYPSQARIVREAMIRLEKGENRVLAGPLPSCLTLDSVRAETGPGCRIAEIAVEDRIVPAENPESRYGVLEARVNALRDERMSTGNRLRALRDEYLLFADRGSISELLDQERPGLINVQYWQEFLAFLEGKLMANRASAREAFFAFLETDEKLNAAQEAFDLVRSQENVIERDAILLLDAESKGEFPVRLSCLQDDASWHPAYGIRVLPARSVAEISFHSMVRQESGEAWNDVGLLFSTAMPLADCRLPELRSRRLREAAAEAIVRAAAPAGQLARRPAEMMKELASSELEMDEACAGDEPAPMAEARASIPVMMKAKSDLRSSREESSRGYGMASGGGLAASTRAAAPSPGFRPPPAPRPAAVPCPPAKSQMQGDSVYGCITAVDAMLGAVPGAESLPRIFGEIAGFLSPPSRPQLPDDGLSGINGFFQDGDDPQESCGGFDYRYEAAKSENTVPSVDSYVQVPVKTMSVPVRLVHVAVPAASERVYLKALFTNSGAPLPGGPAQVFLGNDFVAGIRLPTVAAGQEIAVSLGVDEDIKVISRENAKGRTKGIASRETITDFEVVIEILSFKDKPVEIEIFDRVPVASNPKDADVVDIRYSRPPALSSDRNIVFWRETLKPGEKLLIEIRYSVKVKEDCRIVLTTGAEPHDGTWTGGAA
ncbi:MAG: mucoidy inhibitor MuiA family protein [Spirochaetes bacterium]|nr:mucoidy inhibitor MuiA family protein [Spirochaetota bacterium]